MSEHPQNRPDNPSGDPDRTPPDRAGLARTQRLLGDRYDLSWVIGRGGMSTVWLAYDRQEDRDVAVKILRSEYTDNQEFLSRFRQEAEAAETIHSPNVVATYDYGEAPDGEGGTFCHIIMEYVRGESLADVLARERTLPENLALDVIAQTAVGLQAIHESGMVHRDIKPGNLLITPDGRVKVTDFGIAKAASAVPLTRTGMVVGTAQYVSPEQAQGNDVGPASDVYSLGVVGYEMLCGRRPFSGDSTVSVAIKHISEAPPALPDTVSAPMRELIAVCLRKNPAMRYVDGAELASATVFVSRGELPPRPRAVPDIDPAPATEQLGAVTDITQMGPAPGPAGTSAAAAARADLPGRDPRGTRAGAGQGSRRAPQAVGAAGAGSAGRGTGRPAGRGSRRGGTTVAWVVLGLAAVAAAVGAGVLLASGGDEPDDRPATETRTVTTEVTPDRVPDSDGGGVVPLDPATPQQTVPRTTPTTPRPGGTTPASPTTPATGDGQGGSRTGTDDTDGRGGAGQGGTGGTGQGTGGTGGTGQGTGDTGTGQGGTGQGGTGGTGQGGTGQGGTGGAGQGGGTGGTGQGTGGAPGTGTGAAENPGGPSTPGHGDTGTGTGQGTGGNHPPGRSTGTDTGTTTQAAAATGARAGHASIQRAGFTTL
ncbi:serine/threonine-protein kinase [Corynebacterium bovis]|uniref:non-specific serine/threonine protein kinase n=1 Tax=Corynebacterium bovis DSM 20582 = CIP 54.80 TaxID=927655 RepID=A0A8H9YC91_9CORY|nr:serine/threonine-protein kinase [Corynebacterium bovis]MBB3115989.1 serine/threonine-protein kinase [Corynebacterium bovis DSM 20582 = CIP 54.80]WJY76579.1 Serine/threonine-protein kinase PknA [Corynebacterium bovis DSM 20582 = CIP 54.80]